MDTRVHRGARTPLRLLLVSAAFLLSVAAFADDSRFHPNTEKYADTSLKPAKGRTGDATIEAQALRGKDGITELTITSNGSLDKVQIKIGETTTNFTNSGSSFTTHLNGLPRYTPIAIQANVSGADAARTGVVSVTEKVKNRPELAVQYVQRPPHALAGAPAHIVADVGEMYGDTGARTDCVLVKDGVEIDRAEDIWVNADGIVACEFATVFPAGTGVAENLQVKLDNTVPADYDESSNISEPFSIKVYDSLAQIDQWHAFAMDIETNDYTLNRSSFGESVNRSFGQRSDLLFHAFFRRDEPNVPSLRASMKITTDTMSWPIFDSQDIWLDTMPPDDWGWYKQQCAMGWVGDRGSYVRTCNINSTMDGQYSFFTFNLRSGDVTYVSHGWQSWYANGAPAYYWFWNYRDVYGSGFRIGNTVDFDVQISDGTNMWAVQTTVTPVTTSSSWDYPYTCYTYPDNIWGCAESSGSWLKKEGWTFGGPTP
jgi:hypothetical protein